MDATGRTIKTDKIFYPQTLSHHNEYNPQVKFPFRNIDKSRNVNESTSISKYQGNLGLQTIPEVQLRKPLSNIPHVTLRDIQDKVTNVNVMKQPSFMDADWISMIDNTEDSSLKSQPKNIGSSTPFWIENPKVLFYTFELMPNSDMTDVERLNAMTRIIIVIAAIMFLFKFPVWWLFLSLGLMVVIIFWYIMKGRETMYGDYVRKQREYLRKPKKAILRPINNIIRPINNQVYGTRQQSGSMKPDVNNQELRIVSLR